MAEAVKQHMTLSGGDEEREDRRGLAPEVSADCRVVALMSEGVQQRLELGDADDGQMWRYNRLPACVSQHLRTATASDSLTGVARRHAGQDRARKQVVDHRIGPPSRYPAPG